MIVYDNQGEYGKVAQNDPFAALSFAFRLNKNILQWPRNKRHI